MMKNVVIEMAANVTAINASRRKTNAATDHHPLMKYVSGLVGPGG